MMINYTIIGKNYRDFVFNAKTVRGKLYFTYLQTSNNAFL
jgi:hypothetical protein